ncbi:uncharacterized protein LOC103704097 [Phoenix dactylifera]|uniref:Uncharacterized protein LOC103704097 n=1 Tax=Phoenix dactylifera TaxID=42345 RepID=A0A8B7BU77_PHODC|nr:uncharacterized protein LOC103704097 [Phoenix dactylifera]XP_017697502.2 uncharacterized protein LOC103704097 [Phoenix dactylifera]XP_038981021.1 uncharacterized protein LOC103704097 [Phoenix dactylifera]
MTSTMQTDEAAHEEIRVMEYGAQARIQHHFSKSSKERELTPRQIRHIKMREKEKGLKTAKLNAMTGSDQHAPSVGSASSMPSGSCQKPWPGTKATGAEELVKHMSEVPSYLQRMERRGNIQEKALNFGVLDWGLLEKWTYHQKQMANERGENNSSSSSNQSSSFSTFGSSIQSRGSTGSPIPRRKQSASRKARRNPSVMGSQTQLMENRSSEHVMDFQDPITSNINFSFGHDQHLDADRGRGTDYMRRKNLKDKRKYSGFNGTSRNMSLPPDLSTSCATSKDDATSEILKSVEAEDGRSKKAGQKQDLTLFQNKECMWDRLEQSVHARCSSFESLVSNDGMPPEKHRNSFSGCSPDDIQSTYQSLHVPHSCRLPCGIFTDLPASASKILREKKVQITNPEGQNRKHGQFISSSCDQFQVNADDKLGQAEEKATTATGRELPACLSSAGPTFLSRRSWDGSSVQQSKSIACPDRSGGDKATENNKARRSPFKRILDPFLKPKNHIYFSGPIAASSIHSSHELNDAGKPLMREELALSYGQGNSSDTGINFIWQSKGNLNSSSQAPNDGRGSRKDEGKLASTRQALLQLAWKNGLPLFMFSSSDSEILAATMSKKSIANEDNCKCVYTIFSVHEVKKKSGVWINPTRKTKKHGLLSNVVGRLKVSGSMLTSYDSKSHSVVREFVLLGSEMAPTSHESAGSVCNNELAAIIAQDPQEKPESSRVHLVHSSKCKDSSPVNSAENVCSCCQQKISLQLDQNNDNSSLPTVIAILPSGVHGLSDEGEPSPLIQRWKSGGTCDCGGWDEGCMLTTLTANQEKRSLDLVQASCTTDGTHRFELFVQGGSRESKHAFSMVSFKEGLYTVDFRSSIALLQAFAICISIVHSRKSTIRSVEAETLQEHIIAENARKAPASYVPNHPPLSPVGRA